MNVYEAIQTTNGLLLFIFTFQVAHFVYMIYMDWKSSVRDK